MSRARQACTPLSYLLSVLQGDLYLNFTSTLTLWLDSVSVWKRKEKLNQYLYRPWGFQEVEAPRFQDRRHMKVVRLSAVQTDRLYPSRNISVRGWVDPRAIVRPEGLFQWKITVTPSGIEAATYQLLAQCLGKYKVSWLPEAVTSPFVSLLVYVVKERRISVAHYNRPHSSSQIRTTKRRLYSTVLRTESTNHSIIIKGEITGLPHASPKETKNFG